MKKIIFFITCLVFSSSVFATHEVDSLLRILDKTLLQRQTYTDVKIQRIAKLKILLSNTSTLEQKNVMYGWLFEDYKNFQMDSALRIADQRLVIAKQMNDKNAISTANLNRAEVMSSTGMYKEALDILNAQDRKTFGKEETSYNYHLYHSLYTLMTEYSISDEERQQYNELTLLYKDSILLSIDQDNRGYSLLKSIKLLSLGQYDLALTQANSCYDDFANNGFNTAIIAYVISDIYYHKGDREQQKKYLILSAIQDIQSGTKEYISLRKLAILLYEDGDIDRAYTYMKCAMEDAIFCNARLRTLEISHMLPIINTTYDLKMKQEKARLMGLLIIISVLFCILIGAMMYIYKQLKALSLTRKSLNEANENLKAVNKTLNDLNSDLSESNHVKEEYIGYVFSICSAYIDKLEDLRKKVNRKLKAGQIDDLHKMTKSSSPCQ